MRKILEKQADILVEKALEKKIIDLNHSHKVLFSEKYWRTLLYPWLHQFVNQLIVYDKIIELCIRKNKVMSVRLYDEAHWIPSKSTLDFISSIKHDYSVHVLISFIILNKYKDCFDIEFIETAPGKRSTRVNSIIVWRSLFRSILFKSTFWFSRLFAKSLTIASSVPSNKIHDLKLFFMTGFKWVPHYMTDLFLVKGVGAKSRHDSRKLLSRSVDSDLDLILKGFDTFVPTVYLENFNYTRQYAISGLDIRMIKKVIAASSWYYSEHFKFIAAEAIENGAISIGVQHGGNYGVQKNHPIIRSEISNRDKYITWGWKLFDGIQEDQLLPMPSLKVLNTKKRIDTTHETIILFAGSEMPRYPRWVSKNDFKLFTDRLISQNTFLDHIERKLHDKTVFRGNPVDFGWGQSAELIMKFPEIVIDKHDQKFQESLDETRIFVTNNLSTTYVEALHRNIPTVLFWEEEYVEITDHAKKYFDSFREVNILHDCPESAAEHVNKNYQFINDWWLSEKVQLARREFLSNFVLEGMNPLSCWKELAIAPAVHKK